MRLSRKSAIGLVVMFVVLALLAGVVFDSTRSFQMAASERDFQERVRSSGEYSRLAKRLEDRDDEIRAATASAPELDAWYSAAGPGEAMDAAGEDPVKASTAPIDQSYLVNDTKPFGAPMMDTGPKKPQPAPAGEGEDGPQDTPPGW